MTNPDGEHETHKASDCGNDKEVSSADYVLSCVEGPLRAELCPVLTTC